MHRLSVPFALAALSLTACDLPVEEELGTGQAALHAGNGYTWNAYTWNSFTWNSFTWNSFTWNGLTAGGLPQDIRDDLDDPTVVGPGDTTRGEHVRATLHYIYSCAMPKGSSMTVTTSLGNQYTFEGEIGVAPQWATPPMTTKIQRRALAGALTLPSVVRYQSGPGCDESCKRWVSACVLSRINATGFPVPLSVRGPHPALAADDYERAAFEFHEAAFFGNILQEKMELFSCSHSDWDDVELPDPNGPFGAVSQATLPHSWIEARLCGIQGHPNCPIEHLGRCDQPVAGYSRICDQNNEDWHAGCHGEASPFLWKTYQEVVTSHLDGGPPPWNTIYLPPEEDDDDGGGGRGPVAPTVPGDLPTHMMNAL